MPETTISQRSLYTRIYANENCVTQNDGVVHGAVVVDHMRQSMGARRNWYHCCPIRRTECI